MKENISFSNLDPSRDPIGQALDRIKDYFKTYFRAASFVYRSTSNKAPPIANTILAFNRNTRDFEGGGVIPISVYGNENYYHKNRAPKEARLFKWVKNNLQVSPNRSNFFHLVLQGGNYRKSLKETSNLKMLNTAFDYFIRNFKNNFPLVDYIATIETSPKNGLCHIHFLAQLQKQYPVSRAYDSKNKKEFLNPFPIVKNTINEIWDNAVKMACKKLEIEYTALTKSAFIEGVHDSRIVDYISKQWIAIDRLILKDNGKLRDIERAAILTHFFCKYNNARQVRNSEGIDKIELDPQAPHSVDSLLLLHDKSFNRNTHIFIKMFLTLEEYKERGVALNDFPTGPSVFSSKSPKIPSLRPYNAIKSLVSQYAAAFSLILNHAEKSDYWLNRIYTLEDLISILFDGDLFFIQ